MSNQAVGATGSILASQSAVDEFDTYRWESANAVGWQALKEKKFSRAETLFGSAIQEAQAAQLGDYRCGSSMAGQALARYWNVKKKLDTKDKMPSQVSDPNSEYLDILQLSQSAIICFQATKVTSQYVLHGAKCYLLVAKLLIQLCRPAEAEQHFFQAIKWFEEAGTEGKHTEPHHALGKLYLCRREFKKASAKFRLISQIASDPKRKAFAFLDYVNTESWLGNPRQAKQLSRMWKSFRNKLDAHSPAIDFRAALLLAKIDIEIGSLSGAEEHLARARELVSRNQGEVSDLAVNVMWVLASRVAVLKRDFALADSLHEKIQPLKDYPTKGFAELQLIAVDAGCRQCIMECLCLCHQVICDCCCPCSCRLVCVEQEVTTSRAFDFTEFFTAFAEFDSGRSTLLKGDFPSSEFNLNRALNRLSNVVNPDSPTNLPVITALLQSMRWQNDESRFQELADRAIHISKRAQRLPDGTTPELRAFDPLWIDLYRISGGARNSLAAYEAADFDYVNSIKSGESIRSATHESTLQAQLGRTDVLINLKKFEDARESIGALQESLQIESICEPYYSLKIGLQNARIRIHCRDFDHAHQKLTELEKRWLNSVEARGYSKSHLAPVVLWKLITEVENNKFTVEKSLVNDGFTKLFNQYSKLSKVDSGVTTAMLAHELNRVALILKNDKLYRSAAYLYQKAIELYALSGLPVHQQAVERNLNFLNRTLIRRRKHE